METDTKMEIAGYILRSIENGVNRDLCFTTKEDAQRFKTFTNTYMEESGAGNGYGAYWVMLNWKIIGITELDESFFCNLKDALLEHMCESIAIARTAGDSSGEDIELIVDNSNGAISFQVNNLPDRQRPQKGDMFRTLFSYTAGKIEGRVIEDNGNTLKIVPHWDEGDDGEPTADATFIDVPVVDVMKIDDWKADFRKA